MNRRIALKNIALAAAGLMFLPGCDTTGWKEASVLTPKPFLSPGQEQLLAEIVESIIPATDTPGAKALKVHAYIQKMVLDCYETDVQAALVKGLDTVETLAEKSKGKSFVACSSTEQAELLRQLEQSDDPQQKDFYSLVKRLTIQGYMTSEYVMTNLTQYEMVPGRYNGCVPVSSIPSKVLT